MDSSLIGKLEKAKRYAAEPKRFHFHSLTVTVDGDNSAHTVTYVNGAWQCDCSFFQTRGRCSHTMSLELLLKDMIPEKTE
jgi:hypothetical protein